MGAKPVAAFLSLGLPRELATPKGRQTGANSWVTRFFDGLMALADACKTPLAGGDLSETAIPLADIVLIGSLPSGTALLRSTARPGDLLYVTGTLGGGAASLPHLDRLAARLAKKVKRKSSGLNGLNPAQIPKELRELLARHLYPQPRLIQGARLRSRNLASAAMDMSDGLSSDLAHICEESHVAAEIDPTLLPIHPGASLEYALHGGDDYELLFTAKAGVRVPRKIAGVPITRIGRILLARPSRPAVTLLTSEGPQPLKPKGWEHFS
jgi:thiamine-monophosphate kinase